MVAISQPTGHSTRALHVWALTAWGRLLFCSDSRQGSCLACGGETSARARALFMLQEHGEAGCGAGAWSGIQWAWLRGMIRHSVGRQATDPLLDSVRGEVKQVLG